MLAQAQECAYLKAEKDKKTAGVLARLCKQASFLYSDVLGYLSKPSMKDYFDKTWQVSTSMHMQNHLSCVISRAIVPSKTFPYVWKAGSSVV